MPDQENKTPCGIGLLAHVDAGKTTLSEAMLYEAGARRTLVHLCDVIGAFFIPERWSKKLF